jgi:hypothetical protein
MNTKNPTKAKRGAPRRTPFQVELIRLIAERRPVIGEASGRGLGARLGKSSNHLWQILNRGMVPSGPALLDIARVLALSDAETEGLILRAIETKAETRSRDRFWIGRVRDMVARRDAQIAELEEFVASRGLDGALRDWRAVRMRTRPQA